MLQNKETGAGGQAMPTARALILSHSFRPPCVRELREAFTVRIAGWAHDHKSGRGEAYIQLLNDQSSKLLCAQDTDTRLNQARTTRARIRNPVHAKPTPLPSHSSMDRAITMLPLYISSWREIYTPHLLSRTSQRAAYGNTKRRHTNHPSNSWHSATRHCTVLILQAA